MHIVPATSHEAKQALAARGFGTFQRWAKENRRAAAAMRHDRSRTNLVRALEDEYDRLIRPNLGNR